MSRMARCALALLALLALLCAVLEAADKKLSPDEIIAKHLEALGKPEARAAVKSSIVEGALVFSESYSGKVLDKGNARLMSLGNKARIDLPLSSSKYPGEHFAFDGQKGSVAPTSPGNFSAMGDFMREESFVINDGLLGGALSTNWALLNVKEHGAKLVYDGLKKVGDRELHQVTYIPKKRGETADVRLYFEPESFRHVMTVYSRMRASVSTTMSTGRVVGAGSDEFKQIIEERFSDFRQSDGLMLPTHWEIRTRREPTGASQELQYDVKVSGISHNTLNQ